MKCVLADKILDIDRAGGRAEDKLRRLVESLTEDDLRTVPGKWIREHQSELFWEDNLFDWATARAGR